MIDNHIPMGQVPSLLIDVTTVRVIHCAEAAEAMHAVTRGESRCRHYQGHPPRQSRRSRFGIPCRSHPAWAALFLTRNNRACGGFQIRFSFDAGCTPYSLG